MDCEEARSVLSAAFDDEAAPAAAAAADGHLSGCAACREWAAALHGLTRAMRLEEADVNDLTEPVMAEWDRSRGDAARPRTLVRIGLAVVGLTELALAVPLLFGTRLELLGPLGEHAGRELGAFGITLAVGFLLAAWDGRARGRLGLVATAIALLVATGLADMVQAETDPHYEIAHLPSVLGLGLLWALSRWEPQAERPRPGAGRRDPAGIGRAA